MILLIILDGWGISEKKEGNAILQAHTPRFDHLCSVYPHSTLSASGEDVGLPDKQMGNSEVGHLNLGAGRVVYQDFTRINKAIRDGSFFKERYLLEAVEHAKKNNSKLHLMGLVSDGGVHSHIDHLFSLLKLAKKYDVDVVVHPFLDGRDVLPKSAGIYLKQLQEEMQNQGIGTIGTIMGRYYAMDRDNRWKRTQRAYEALTGVRGPTAASFEDVLEASYERKETDEFVQPNILGETIKNGDSVIFFNFRPDRARQLAMAFVDDPFKYFERKKLDIFFVCMTEYDEDIKAPVVYLPLSLKNTLGEVLSNHGLKQLRIAETEKYYHVTYFFNGGEEAPFKGEDRILIPSPKVDTYDLQPEMSAYKITDRVLKEIHSGKYHVIIMNFANPDMVGHTGDLEAAIEAIEVVDECIGRIYDGCNIGESDNVILITADHGNAEQMIEYHTKKIYTAHTPNPVPFITTKKCHVRSGILADVAPTILDLLGIEKPAEMDGESLIKEPEK
jgi:2,3-bisphosphoglycerate-independent phosphoglycerate mutase